MKSIYSLFVLFFLLTIQGKTTPFSIQYKTNIQNNSSAVVQPSCFEINNNRSESILLDVSIITEENDQDEFDHSKKKTNKKSSKKTEYNLFSREPYLNTSSYKHFISGRTFLEMDQFYLFLCILRI